MLAYYGTRISEHMTDTPEGYLICHDVPIARTGAQEYYARELGLEGDPDRVITVQRYPADVFDAATIASFEGKDITDRHPPENITPATYGMYSRGHIENVRRSGDYLVADMHVKDPKLISDIKNGVMREVSCGYTCLYTPDGDGFKQTTIRGNHVAVVPKGRAGAHVAIKDEAAEETAEKGRKRKMSKFAEAILSAFGMAAQDAKPEDMPELTKLAANALDAVPAEKAPEAEPAKEGEEVKAKDVEEIRAPKGDDIGSKLDKVIEMLAELGKKNDREEKKLTDERDLDDLIKKMTEREAAEEIAEETAENDPRAAVTLPVKKAEEIDECGSEPTNDAAVVKMLRAVRPAVAAIKNREERARVTDALLNAVRGEKNAYGDIMSATKDAAQKASDAARLSRHEKNCAEQQATYDALNPHKKKEVK